MNLRILTTFLLVVFFSITSAQDKLTEKPLKVFFDYYGTIFRYVQTDIDFIDLVRNPNIANVHLMLNGIRTGSGGSEYTLTFVGQNGFKGINDTLKQSFTMNISNEERNKELVRLIKLGLVRYLIRTPYNDFIQINFTKNFENEKMIKDNWDGWVFGIGLKSSFEAEESQKEFNWELDFDIDRVSEYSKFSVDLNIGNYMEIYSSDDGESTIYKRQRSFKTLYVLSISDHFSAGFFSGFSNSTYNNLKAAYDFAPAIEYNVFPYYESVRRNFTFLYRFGYVYNDYYNQTIYFKNNESLIRHSLSIGYSINETWGESRVYLSANNYLHDLTKIRVELWSRLSYRLTGSLKFDLQASASYINDQLYLEQEGATLEEILFNRKSLATGYEYKLGIGFRYTFGSIYNNIVNTRF